MRTVILLGALALAACSAGTFTDTSSPELAPGEPRTISVRNATAEPIAYVAAGEGTLALLITPPTLRPGEYGTRVVHPGATETLPRAEIIGYLEELGITFYVWRVDPATGDGRLAGSFLVTAAELEDHAGLVTVTPSRP